MWENKEKGIGDYGNERDFFFSGVCHSFNASKESWDQGLYSNHLEATAHTV